MARASLLPFPGIVITLAANLLIAFVARRTQSPAIYEEPTENASGEMGNASGLAGSRTVLMESSSETVVKDHPVKQKRRDDLYKDLNEKDLHHFGGSQRGLFNFGGSQRGLLNGRRRERVRERVRRWERRNEPDKGLKVVDHERFGTLHDTDIDLLVRYLDLKKKPPLTYQTQG